MSCESLWLSLIRVTHGDVEAWIDPSEAVTIQVGTIEKMGMNWATVVIVHNNGREFQWRFSEAQQATDGTIAQAREFAAELASRVNAARAGEAVDDGA